MVSPGHAKVKATRSRSVSAIQRQPQLPIPLERAALAPTKVHEGRDSANTWGRLACGEKPSSRLPQTGAGAPTYQVSHAGLFVPAFDGDEECDTPRPWQSFAVSRVGD